MLTDGTNTAVAIGATTNVLIGRPLEFIGAPSVLRLLLAADLNLATAQLLMNVGGDQRVPLSAGTAVPVTSTPGGGPKDDEDTVLPQVAIPPGARLQLNITNGNAAINNVRYRGIIAP